MLETGFVLAYDIHKEFARHYFLYGDYDRFLSQFISFDKLLILLKVFSNDFKLNFFI
jgi:hypothetical protein